MELEKLIKECKKERITAQKYLYDKYANLFFIFCRRYLKSDEEAEDVLQNGYISIFTGLKSFIYQTDSATIAWMKKIMLNECLQHLRKNRSWLIVAEKEAEEIKAEELILDHLNATDIVKLITQLPIGYRTVFNLYEIEGFTHAEISNTLKISIGTSKSQ